MADNTLKLRIKLRAKTSAEWEAIKNTDIPLDGEYCYVKDLNKVKMGNGKDTFYTLPWLTMSPSEISELIDEAQLYTSNVPTVNAFGGIPAGWTAEDIPLVDVIDKLLHPWVAPAVSAKTSPNGGVFEKGDTKSINTINVSVTRKSASIKKIDILLNGTGTAIATKTDGISGGGTFDIPFTAQSLSSANTFFKANVTDADNKVTGANSGTFNFVYPFYYGAVTVAAPNEANIKALTKVIQTKGNKTFTFTSNNSRCCMAYPKAYGNLKKILDANGFDVTGTFNKTEVNITGLDKTAQAYNVYTLAAPSTVSGFNFQFQF